MNAITNFSKTIERAENLLSLHRQAYKRGRPPTDWTVDVLRSAVVFAVAALDAYMHDKIVETIPLIIKHGTQGIPGKFVDILKEQVKYEGLLSIMFRSRPQDHLVTAIRKSYEKRTLQDPADIENAIKIIGVDDLWFSMSVQLKKRKGKSRKINKSGAKIFLEKYVLRRHHIVHEGDRYTSKIHKDKLRDIKREFVVNCIKDIKAFVKALNKIIDQKYKSLK